MDVVSALELFAYKVGEMVEAVSSDLDRLTQKAESTRAAVKEAEAAESTLTPGDQSQIGESIGSSSSASAALAEVTASLTQQVGRR